MNKLIGSDIEYAVLSRDKREFIPAGLLPINGRKGHPEPLTFGGVEIDCCAVEITPAPASTKEEFSTNILSLLGEVKEKYPEYEFWTKPSLIFRPQQIQGVRYAEEMGCMPDFNAWTGNTNPKPNADLSPGLRSFGGHVHIEGGTVPTVIACDVLLGLWSLIHDKDVRRRGLYGKAGAFRNKSYGVEYRVLSNFWTDDKDKIEHVFEMANIARKLPNSSIQDLLNMCGGEKRLIKAINYSTPDPQWGIPEDFYEVVVKKARDLAHAA